MSEPHVAPKPGEVSAMYERCVLKRRRKSSRACSAKARIAFWFVCAAMGVLLAGLRYGANSAEGAVWEKAFACNLGAGPIAGESAILLFAAGNFFLGTVLTALCAVFANRSGWFGTAIVAACFALLYHNEARCGMPVSTTMTLAAIACIGILLGWVARQEHKRIL